MEILKTVERTIRTYLGFFEMRERSLMFGFETAILADGKTLPELSKMFSFEGEEYQKFRVENSELFTDIEKAVFAIISRPHDDYRIVLLRITTSQIFIHAEKNGAGDIVPVLTIEGEALKQTLIEHLELVKATEAITWNYGSGRNGFLNG